MRVLALLLFASVLAVPVPAAASDPECPSRAVGIGDVSRIEGGQLGGHSLAFTVWTAGCAPGSVSYQTIQATALEGVDFTGGTGTLSWGRGDTGNRTIVVPILGELAEENDESMTAYLHTPVGLSIIDSTGLGRILNDDTTQPVYHSDGEPLCTLRAAPHCLVLITTDNPVNTNVAVQFSTMSGTALAGLDFVGVSFGVVTIAAGTSTAVIQIQKLSPSAGKYFYVRLPAHSASARVTFA